MWKKPEEQQMQPSQQLSGNAVLKPERPESPGTALIGKSIRVKGEICGVEDLVVEGEVEGQIDLKQNAVVVGKGGKVCANIQGKIIQVYGEVIGDLFGSEQIVIHESGSVRGNVSAPRVSLKDGARLKGAINTEPEPNKLPSAQKVVESFKTSSNGTKAQPSTSAHL